MIKNEWFDQSKVENLYPEAVMIPPMKIGKFPGTKGITIHDICTNGEYFANIKKDGAMYIYDNTPNHAYLFGRTNSTKTGLLTEKGDNVPHIMSKLKEVLPPNTILVGEIYYPGGTAKDTVTIMGCLPKKAIERQKNNPIHYYIHDILMYNGESYLELGAQQRYFKLMEAFNKIDLPDTIELAKYYDSKDIDLEAFADKMIARGEEGLVLKKKDGLYEPGLRPAWNMIKLKRHDTVDVVAVRAIEPTKLYNGDDIANWEYCIDEQTEVRYQGQYAALRMKYSNIIAVTKAYFYGWYTAMDIGAYDEKGNLKVIGSVSSGFNDADRAALKSYEGKVLELGVMEKDNTEQTLRHPIVMRVRDDKNPTDCKLKEIFS